MAGLVTKRKRRLCSHGPVQHRILLYLSGNIQYIIYHLIFSQTSPGFYVSAAQVS